MAEIAAVVGNFQGEKVLEDCLDSLAQQTLRPSEVVVVDAGSTDASLEIARDRGARTIPARNRGIGSLYNRGVEAVSAPFVLLLNNDVALHERCVERLAGELAADPRRFAADPRQRDWENRRDIHRLSMMTRGPLLRQPLPGFRIDQNVPSERVAPTLLANGAAFLVRRRELLELGGFDESFFMEWEEIDLACRARSRGWEIVYVPDAVVRHRVGAVTTPDVVPRRLRSSHHNLVRFALKCLPVRAASRVVAGELLRLPRHPLLVVPALARVAVELPEILRERRRVRGR